jgi:hypothetical protein
VEDAIAGVASGRRPSLLEQEDDQMTDAYEPTEKQHTRKARAKENARQIQKHFAMGNQAAAWFCRCLFYEWEQLAEEDTTCPEHRLIDRLMEWVNSLGLDPELHFIPNETQVRRIIDYMAEGNDCSLAFLCGE